MMTKQQSRKRPVPAGGKGDGHPRLDRDVQLRIGEELRAMYDEVVKQGVPDRFVELLSKIDNGDRAEKGSDDK